MYRLLKFEFASDATFSDPVPFELVPATSTAKISAVSMPQSDLQAVKDACRELIDQPIDAVTDTEKTIASSGLVIEYDDSAQTIKIGAVLLQVAQVEGLIQGLLDFSLVT